MRKRLKISKNNLIRIVCQAIALVYIVCAIAFERDASTKNFTSLTLYLLAVSGLVYFVLQRKMYLDVYNICMISLCVYAIFMLSFTSFSVGFEAAYNLCTCVIIGLIISNYVFYDMKLAQKVLVAVWIGAICVVYLIIKSYGGVLNMIVFATTDKYIHRVGEDVNNSNLIAIFMSNAILASIVYIWQKKEMHLIFKALVIVVDACLLVVMFLTASRLSVVITLFGVLALWLYHTGKENLLGKIKAIIVLAAVLIACYLAIMNIPIFFSVRERLTYTLEVVSGVSDTNDSDGNRTYYVTEGLKYFWESPIFGNGTNFTAQVFGTYTHNNYLELLVNYGIVGLLLYYVPYIAILFRLFPLLKERDNMAAYFIIYILIQLISNFFGVNYYRRTSQIFVAVAWGYAAARIKEKNKAEEALPDAAFAVKNEQNNISPQINL